MMGIIRVTKKVRKPCSKVALPPISIPQVSLPSVLPVVVDVLVVAAPVPLPPVHPVVHSTLSTSRRKVIVDRTWRTRVPSGYCKLFNDINLLSCLASDSGKLPLMDSLRLFLSPAIVVVSIRTLVVAFAVTVRNYRLLVVRHLLKGSFQFWLRERDQTFDNPSWAVKPLRLRPVPVPACNVEVSTSFVCDQARGSLQRAQQHQRQR